MKTQRPWLWMVLVIPMLSLVPGCPDRGPNPAGEVNSANGLPVEIETTLSPRAIIETTLGTIKLELNGERAPGTVANFVTYANAGFYDGTIFHRVIPGFITQGGGYTPDTHLKTDGWRDLIDLESKEGLSNTRGTIAMAHSDDDALDARCEFFFNLADNAERLNYRMSVSPNGFAAFGTVTEGMDFVDQISQVEVEYKPATGDREGTIMPVVPVMIHTVRIEGAYDFAEAAILAEPTIKRTAYWRDKRAEHQQHVQAEVAHLLEERVKSIEAEIGEQMVLKPSGLRYVEIVAGTGISPTANDKVRFHYRGTFLDGSPFESSYDLGNEPTLTSYSKLLAGLREGLETMKAGGTRYLIIPPELAYGTKGRPGIPPDSTLVFRLELIAVE